MTIALGIIATDGIVVAADRQVTAQNYLKYDEGKVSMHGRMHIPGMAERATSELLITGAGSPTSITHIRQGLIEAFNRRDDIFSISNFRSEVDEQVKAFHDAHAKESDGALDVWMVIGGRDSRGQRKLWITDHGVVNEEASFAAVGAGAMYAQTIMGRLGGLADTAGAVLLAAFVIHEVKNTIDGCGSGTDIYAVSRDGAYVTPSSVINQLSVVFNRYTRMSRDLLYDTFNDHINWYGQKRISIKREVVKLRREVAEILQRVEAIRGPNLGQKADDVADVPKPGSDTSSHGGSDT